MNKGKICLNMIVKNESRIIKRCLESVYHLVDTWCIIDTGSTDGTQEIIKEFLKDKPGELIERPWVNFGHNRNEALQLAEKWGDWIFLTDADMILVDNGFDKNSLDNSLDGYDVYQDNHGVRYTNTRLLKSSSKWKCVGVTHEYYTTASGVRNLKTAETLSFTDLGDGGSKSDKFERDIRLLEQGLIDEPGNVRYMFYLAQSYRDTRNWDKAIEWYTKCKSLSQWDEEKWFSMYMIGWCKSVSRKFTLEEISQDLFSAWMERPHRVEPIFQLSIEYKERKMWSNAYQLLKICATAKYPVNDTLFISAGIYEGSAVDEFSVAAYYVGEYEEARIASINAEKTTYGKIHSQRIQLNRWYAEKALGYYSPERLEKRLSEIKELVENEYELKSKENV
jgi:glycosyltransferase involved in cell wall biosynthesis